MIMNHTNSGVVQCIFGRAQAHHRHPPNHARLALLGLELQVERFNSDNCKWSLKRSTELQECFGLLKDTVLDREQEHSKCTNELITVIFSVLSEITTPIMVQSQI